MSNTSFHTLLKNKWEEQKFVCVGLDPVLEKIPQQLKAQYSSNYEIIFNFLKEIVDVTNEYVCAYKPNAAFFEQYGADGEKALEDINEYIHQNFPDLPIIGDFKRGDIGNTNSAYAKSAFERFKLDAITVNPYLGKEALEPFLSYSEKGIIVLVKTSNPGSGEFQDQKLENGQLLYELIAENIVNHWNTNGNCGVVVGATYPKQLKRVREIIGEIPMLIPGIGTQGGSLEETIHSAKDKSNQGMIINSSSGIIFSENPKQATLKLHQDIVNSLK